MVTDSANLFSGAQMLDGKRNMDIKGACVGASRRLTCGDRIDWSGRPLTAAHPCIDPTTVNLATTLPLIDDARPIKQRVVVASFPERQNRMWRYFEQRRYKVRFVGNFVRW